jgi:glycosyltransferase involved in cell wall biosynthesis
MRILHTIESLTKGAAGVFHFLNDLTRRQRELGWEVVVVGCQDPAFARDAHHWKHAQTEFVRPLPIRFLPFATGLREIVSRVQPDLIHCHGLWTYHSTTVPPLCRAKKIPFIISPHGMLEPWAWQHRAWKKRPVWWLWEKRFLQQASALHATADQEAQNLRKLGLINPIIMLPVGVDVPLERQRSEVRGQRSGVRTALFISRIHPKKGLLDLVRAWNLVRPDGWRVIVAGPDSNGHQAVVQQAVQAAGLADCFEFPGPVYDAAKWSLYESADLFILPTYSENFGIVIAEALAAGVPVITTKGAPWAELPARQCGWWVDIGVEPLAAALREASSLSDPERQAMGQRGCLLVEENYSWPKIAREFKAVYEWLLGGGTKPECVQIKS